MRPLTAAIAFALCTWMAIVPARAHDRPDRSTPVTPLAPRADEGENPYLESDKLFLWRVHWINHMEIQTGDLATSRGTADVAAVGSMLARDHRRIENALLRLASNKRIELQLTSEEYRRVREPLARQMAATMDLAHERGDAFDSAFLTRAADGHLATIDLLRTYRGLTNDDDIRAFIDGTLPTLQEHHRRAEALLAAARDERQFVRGTEPSATKKAKEKSASSETEVREADKPEAGLDKQEEIERDLEQRGKRQRDPAERIDRESEEIERAGRPPNDPVPIDPKGP